MAEAAAQLEHLTDSLAATVAMRITAEKQRLQGLTLRLPAAFALRKANETNAITLRNQRLLTAVSTLMALLCHGP